MAFIRRNRVWLAPSTIVALGVALILWIAVGAPNRSDASPPPGALANQTTWAPLDSVAAGQIDRLRRDAGLDDDALIALNLTSVQLENWLGSIRTWYEANSEQFAARRQALADVRGMIVLHQGAISRGEDARTQLEAARAQLLQLQSDFDTFVNGCASNRRSELTESQQTLMDRMRQQRDLPIPYRVLSLTPEQRSALQAALQRYAQRCTTLRADDAREEARVALDREISAAIGAANVQLLDSLRQYVGVSADRLVAALGTVFPVEDES